MKKTASRTLGLSLIVAGACFLIDPFFSLIDLIPDCIGYLLICRGLRMTADLNDTVAAARKGFFRMALLTAARYVVLLFVFGATSIAEQGTELLLFTFVFAVLDAIVLVPALRDAGNGMTTLASLHGGTAPLETPGRGSRSRTDRLVAGTICFLLAKELLAVLPELLILLSDRSGEQDLIRFSGLYEYIGGFRFIAGIIVLAAGIVWLVGLIRYAVRLRSDADYLYTLGDAHALMLQSHPDLYTVRTLRRGMTLMTVGTGFLITFLADGVSVIPDAVCAVLFIVAAAMLHKYADGTRRVIAAACVFIPVSIAAEIAQSLIMRELAGTDGDDFTIVDNAARLARDPEQLAAFYRVCLIMLASQVLLIVLLWTLKPVLDSIIDQRTGYTVTDRYPERMKAEHMRLKRGVVRLLVFGSIVCILPVLYMYFLPNAKNTVTQIQSTGDFLLSLTHSVMESFNVIDFLTHAVFTCCFVKVTSDIREQMEYRFLLS